MTESVMMGRVNASLTTWFPLFTAAATVIAAILTGFGAAALRNRWDTEVRTATWAREAQKDRRAETTRAYEAELHALMTAEQWLWHAFNARKQVLQLEGDKQDHIHDAMRMHGATFAVVMLLGNPSVTGHMADVNKRLVACWVDATRENLQNLRAARDELTVRMRADIGVQSTLS